jgi:hypothetical protein
MQSFLLALAVAFAAFCAWLGVRIVNRRERWAKWTAVGLGVLLVYPLSFGPACWISSRTGRGFAAVNMVYQPLMKACWRGSVPPNKDLLQRYAKFFAPIDQVNLWSVGYYRDRDLYAWEGLVWTGQTWMSRPQ